MSPQRSGCVTYLAMDAWGDCFAGCLPQVFYGFRSHPDGDMEFLGTVNRGDEKPKWLQEASTCMNLPW